MIYWLLANILVVIHIAFVMFVVFGGLLVLRKPKIIYLHIPAVIWGILVEFNSWICPLTPWEQELRVAGGEAGYTGGFIEHYLVPLLYPPNLDWNIQVVLGSLVIITNIIVYSLLGIIIKRQNTD